MSMRSTQEEADTRLVLHAVHSQFKTVVISSRDTDVLLLLVTNFPLTQCDHLRMISGTSKKRRYIPIDAVFNNLPRNSYTALIPFHALAGYDTTCLTNHTKQSSWKVFKEHHNLLKNLGIGEHTQETISWQRHSSAECRMCTEQTLSLQHDICCSPRLLNQKQSHQQVMLIISI